MSTRNPDIGWTALDPAKADYGAVEGAYVNGITLLAMNSGKTVCVVGHCSCTTKADAERIARKSSSHEADRFVSRKRLMSWFVQPA